ncbi:MAG: 6-pyruvoyl trahydropterin synthase family protein [Bacteroidales bacterium]
MSVIRITKEFHFEMAHALWNYDGPCRNIHGHSYALYVTVVGKPLQNPGHPKNGMLIDFSELKNIVKKQILEQFDHALVVNRNTPQEFNTQARELFGKVHFLDYQPTCENLITDMAARLQKSLPPTVRLHSLRLYETATSYAEWYADDNS